MDFFSTDNKLGILGGGQLGKMLLYYTQQWNIKTHVLDPDEFAPAKLACDVFVKGNLMDYETVLNFGRKVNILTIEIENVNVDALFDLKKEGVKVYPQPEVIKTIQNKSSQKDFYKKNNIPTSNYRKYSDLELVKNDVAKGKLSFPFVWKSSMMGYDGFGVSVIRKNKDLEKLSNSMCIIEDFIPFKTEISVIVARREQGEIKEYPSVEMEFHPTANQLESVISPARISNDIEIKAKNLAIKVSELYKHVGLLAIEMFLTETGEILVNEAAPRPHNSGHVTIESSFTNQFEQHIRAILNLPLGKTEIKIPGVMVNLVGNKSHHGSVLYKNIDQILAIDGVTPHIYGKKETRPYRKMGHITVINNSLDKAKNIAEEVKSIIEVISK